MQLENTAERYGVVAKSLHWTIFVLLVAAYVLGFGVMGAEEGATVFGRPRASIFNVHGTIGITILVLAAVRLWWRRSRPLPQWSPGLTSVERKRWHRIELTLYTMLFAKPLSGLLLAGSAGIDIAFLGIIDLPSLAPENNSLRDVMLALHIVTGLILLLTFIAHVVLGVRHHIRERDRHLNRMLPFTHQ